MAKTSRKNSRTKSTAKNTSVSRKKSSEILCSHRTPTQLHASTYAYKKLS